jgi:epoxyqueuosine reductase
METRAELVNPALEWLATMDGREFKRRFKGSPLERTGRKRLLRNVAIAMGNSGAERFLPQLDAWAEASGAEGSSGGNAPIDPMVSEAAEWARTRIRAKR